VESPVVQAGQKLQTNDVKTRLSRAPKMDGHCLHIPFCKIKSCFSTLEIISMAGYGLFLLKRYL